MRKSGAAPEANDRAMGSRRELPVPNTAPLPAALTDTLRNADSIYLSLKANGVPEMQILALDQALHGVFDAGKSSRPGDVYTLQMDGEDRIEGFTYTPVATPEQLVIVERIDGQLSGRRHVIELELRLAAFQVDIDDNLSNAVASAGETDWLTDRLADFIFGSVIDFRKDPRRGDRLGVVVRKFYKDDRFVRYDRVLLARYEGRVVSRMAVSYETPTAGHGYYDRAGVSLERMFLLKPLPFRRISSGFSKRRFHPILRKNVPHLGTDYAADTGTAVWATARGKVSFAGVKGGYGKMVEIEHPNGYRTRYAHLSRITVRRGQRVDKQKSVGRVGSSGRATGPHLHYELLRNGVHMNPAGANRGSHGRPLDNAHLASFSRHRDRLLDMLDSAAPEEFVVVTGDASER